MTKRPLPPTDATLRPPPLMLAELPSPWPRDVDHSNIYVTIVEAAQLMNWSTTTIRRLIDGRFLPQEYRGVIRLMDLLTAVGDYCAYGKGAEIHRPDFHV